MEKKINQKLEALLQSMTLNEEVEILIEEVLNSNSSLESKIALIEAIKESQNL